MIKEIAALIGKKENTISNWHTRNKNLHMLVKYGYMVYKLKKENKRLTDKDIQDLFNFLSNIRK